MIPAASPATPVIPVTPASPAAVVSARTGLTVQRSTTTQTGVPRPQVRLSLATQTEPAPAGLPARSARAASGSGAGGGFGRPGPEIAGSLLDATGRQPMIHALRDPDLLRIVLGLPRPARPAASGSGSGS